MFRVLVVTGCLLGAASAMMRGTNGAVTHAQRAQQRMAPDLVAQNLVQVERKWMAQAMALHECQGVNSTKVQLRDCEFAEHSFVESCEKVAMAIVQGSSGDKGDAREYMDDVCGEPSLQKEGPTPQRLCTAFASSLVDGMSADQYSNREDLDVQKLCESFLRNGDLRDIAEAEVRRQEEEEARIAEQKRKEKEAEEEREEQERKALEAKRVAEEAERAQKEADEKKALAEAKKAEQEKKAKEAKQKEEEVKAAEEEAKNAMEHVKNVASGKNTTVATKKEKMPEPAKNATEENAAPAVNPKAALLAQKFEAALQKRDLALVKTEDTCVTKQQGARALIQEKLAVFGVQCEDMCKEMGVYPKCQCPGFAGQPADGDDNRACIAKNCQDPTSPCPNDAFMTCVKETTKVSVLQWDSLMQKFDSTMGLYKNSLAAAKKAKEIRCPAPIFVAEGQYCVCKDPENCPSTAETLTPEQAAKLAAEAHTWNQSGAPGTR